MGSWRKEYEVGVGRVESGGQHYRKKLLSESELGIRKYRSVESNDDNVKENVRFVATGSKFNKELDENILNRRERQIAYGKNMVDYDKYMTMVSKRDRKERMPRTPNKYKKFSRRQWDGLVKNWKQEIHTTVAALEKAEMKFAENEVKTVIEEVWKVEKMSFE